MCPGEVPSDVGLEVLCLVRHGDFALLIVHTS
jgi:hypothetical protein